MIAATMITSIIIQACLLLMVIDVLGVLVLMVVASTWRRGAVLTPFPAPALSDKVAPYRGPHVRNYGAEIVENPGQAVEKTGKSGKSRGFDV